MGLLICSERFGTVWDFRLADYALRCKPDARDWERFVTLWCSAWHALARFGSEAATLRVASLLCMQRLRWSVERRSEISCGSLPSTGLAAGSGVEMKHQEGGQGSARSKQGGCPPLIVRWSAGVVCARPGACAALSGVPTKVLRSC